MSGTFNSGRSREVFPDLFWTISNNYFEEEGDEDEILDKVNIKVKLKKRINKREHHTDKYGDRRPIVRRGQEFMVEVHLNRAFDKNEDRITFTFLKGKRPQLSKGTKVNVKLAKDKNSAKISSDEWYGYITSVDGNSDKAEIKCKIVASADALVGRYKIITKVFDNDPKKKTKKYVWDVGRKMFLLFNPWCKDDQVYLSSEDEMKEYMLSETGRIFKSDNPSNKGYGWNFGQFSKYSLRAAVRLLKRSYLTNDKHGNPVCVSRALSAMANSLDNDGVLVGNWSGDYEGGKRPTAWMSSVAILEQYCKTKKPVKYGQCWVFSGILTTLCRTLGIPTRSVTNFNSAHDSDGSCTIDNHYREDGTPMNSLDDSIWNFHVWNEAWMSRPDLPDNYCGPGWQAIDSTPQESSGGIHRCGPSPLGAIKKGDVNIGQDTKFIFAEVNGEIIDWIVERNGNMRPKLNKYRDPVGRIVLTKAVGKNERNDITKLYKYGEGTSKEEAVMEKAALCGTRKSYLKNLFDDTVEDVVFTFGVNVKENGDVTMTYSAKNTSTSEKNVVYILYADGVTYNAPNGVELMYILDQFTLPPSKIMTRTEMIEGSFYLNVITQEQSLKVGVASLVVETKQLFRKFTIVDYVKPDVDVTVSNKRPKVGEAINVTLSFKNPTDTELTECTFCLDGLGVIKEKKIEINRPVRQHEIIREDIKVTPKYEGETTLIATFDCRQLNDINGYVEITVTN